MRYFVGLTLCLTVGLLEARQFMDVTAWVNKTVEPLDNRNGPDFTPVATGSSRSCQTDSGVPGTCVTLNLCAGENKVGDPDDFTLRTGGCSHYLEICCPPDRIREKPKKPVLPENSGCGWSNPAANILKEKVDSSKQLSERADFGEFPWMVAIIKKSQYDKWIQGDYLGGGSLIHPSVVVTVAHKVDTITAEEIKCRAGEWDTQTETETYPYQERDVTDIVKHEGFLRKTAVNNVALLIMKTPFVLASHIGIACLGKTMPPPSTYCYSMGWGAEQFNKKDLYAVTLKKVKVPIVDRQVCENWLKQTPQLGNTYKLLPSLTCAGGEENVDTCDGDGGSSLVCPIAESDDGTRYEVYGMVAYGVHGCGVKNVPGVYVDIPQMYSWIERKMKELKYETKYNP